jgi:molybdopterin converting factor small subunit
VTVRVVLPRLLAPVVGERLTLEVRGETVGEILDDLIRLEPGLGVHLFDGAGDLRPHVLCFVDGVATRLEDRRMPVPAGVEVVFLQAVSGGRG